MADTKVSAFPVVGAVIATDYFPVIVTPGITNGSATLTVIFAPHLAAVDPHPQYLTGTEGDAAYLLKSLADVKGDLIAATGNDAFTRLAIGTNNQVLTADSAAATGMKWAAASGGISIGLASALPNAIQLR